MTTETGRVRRRVETILAEEIRRPHTTTPVEKEQHRASIDIVRVVVELRRLML